MLQLGGSRRYLHGQSCIYRQTSIQNLFATIWSLLLFSITPVSCFECPLAKILVELLWTAADRDMLQFPSRPCSRPTLCPGEDRLQRSSVHDPSYQGNLQMAHTGLCASEQHHVNVGSKNITLHRSRPYFDFASNRDDRLLHHTYGIRS